LQVPEGRLAELSGRMEVCLTSLAKEQAAYILANLELSPILTILAQVDITQQHPLGLAPSHLVLVCLFNIFGLLPLVCTVEAPYSKFFGTPDPNFL
jgi:hypothetical protein